MMPPTAATQKVGRAAILRSYSGFLARRCRMTNRIKATIVTTSRPSDQGAACSATGAKLIARMNDPTSTSERMPPRLSTGSVVSLTCAGTNLGAMNSATTATGRTTKKTEFQGKRTSSRPESSGPQALIAPPMAAHSAIERVRAGPGHSAAIKASVVG